MPLSPDLRHALLVAAGITERDLARQLHEQPDAPLRPMSLADLLAEERARQDRGR